jgi:hypothetical protein
MKQKYQAYVINEQGASEYIEYKGNTNVQAIYNYVRKNYGPGWTLHITDRGVEIFAVTLKK